MKKYICFLLFLILPGVYGHLDAGIDKDVGEYTIDFGHSPAKFNTEEGSFLVFNLFNKTSQELIIPKSAWVRISNSEGVLFAGTMHPDPSNIGFSYKFNKPDDYDIKIRFQENDKNLVETTFDIKVENDAKYILKGVLVAALIGIAVIFYIRRTK